jgi:hypothetical protein
LFSETGPWRWTDPPPEESYQVSKGSISKKEKNLTPEKGIRKMRKKKKKKFSETEAVTHVISFWKALAMLRLLSYTFPFKYPRGKSEH